MVTYANGHYGLNPNYPFEERICGKSLVYILDDLDELNPAQQVQMRPSNDNNP